MLAPLPASDWNETTAAHLLLRTGFGATQQEIQECAAAGLDASVDRLVDWEKTPDPTADPEWAKPDPTLAEQRRALRNLPEEERRMKFQEFQRQQREQLHELKQWWLERMRNGPRPLQEKLTLFWHGHFATSAEKVKIAYFMWRQNDIFRRLGNGPFRNLLLEVGRDPAMLVWLDGAQSRKDAPNENYGRELLELFTLGEGHYTEDDIKAAARAFTGWTVNRFNQTASFQKFNHHDGRKTFLGASGNFNDEDIIDQILGQNQCARHLSNRLWSFFAYQNPPAALADSLGDSLYRLNYDLRPFLKAMFRSREFYSARAIGTQIKSPVQWLLATAKSAEMARFPGRAAIGLLTQLGQNLLEPPSVKGWDGGRTWVSTTTLLLRQNAAKLFVYGGDPGGVMFNREDMARRLEKLQELRKTEGKEGAPMEDDPMMARMERMKNRNNKMPAMIDPRKLAPAGTPDDNAALIESLLRRFYPTGAPAAAGKAFADYLAQSPDKSLEEKTKGLAYLMMARPEYQLT
ncbi:MAG: DUF1800 domain-containing protein [Candidatus Methylacidiphilales bacterium]|nr:DUF1800 domain-containing protein [Candidatus Methylacidiphilales bacterium]